MEVGEVTSRSISLESPSKTAEHIRRMREKVKVTLVQALRPCTGRTAHRWFRGIALLFHDHGTRRGERSALRPGRSLSPGKTRCPLYRRMIGPQGRSGQVRKISPLPRFDSRTVQAVASRYTDWATRANGKAVNITYSECVSVALVIQHAMRMPRVIFPSVACPAVPFFFRHYLINGTILGGKNLLNTKCVFWLSVHHFVWNSFNCKNNGARCYHNGS